MKLRETPVNELTQLIASKAPAPGGGGASALVGAIGIALGDMVGELTVGKKKYADVEGEMTALMERAQILRQRLLELIDEDEENFLPLSKAYGLPKDAPGRDAEMERCLLLAAKTPLEIFDIACETIRMQEKFADKGSKLMISDAATGVAFCRAALYGAAMNITVNTRLMKNREKAAELDRHVRENLDKYGRLADEIYDQVVNELCVKEKK